MTVASKFFVEKIKYRNCCNDLIHSDTCFKRALINIPFLFIGNAKYFAPIVLIPILVKILLRKFDKASLKDTWKYYLEITCSASVIGWVISTSTCAFRQLFGEFKYATFVFVPTMFGGLVAPHFGRRSWRLFEISIFQCFIESVLFRRDNIIAKAITHSLILQVWLFMCFSAIILQAKQHKIFEEFWFVPPNLGIPKQLDENIENLPINKCVHHEKLCGTYLIKGLRYFITIGLIIDTIKMLMSQPIPSKNFVHKLISKIRNFKLHTTVFLTTYVGIYRATNCYFNRTAPANPLLNHLMAGFLGGSSYIFYPNHTIFSYSALISIQTLWKLYKEQSNSKNYKNDNTILKILKKSPIAKIIFPFLVGYLAHTYCFYGEQGVGKFAETIINGVTNNYAINMRNKL